MIARPRASRRGATRRWALAALMVAAAPTVAACGDDDEGAITATETAPAVEAAYRADLEPLNLSGVSGVATIDMTADALRVQIQADGMVPDMEHPQHVHQPTGDAEAVCPTPDADTDGDGIVSLEEAEPAYGPVVLPLEPYPTAERGEVEFVANYEPLGADARPLDEGAVVLHGGMVDGEYVATLPVACGAIELVENGTGTVTEEVTETETDTDTVTDEVIETETDTDTVTDEVTETETETDAVTDEVTETETDTVTEQATTETSP